MIKPRPPFTDEELVAYMCRSSGDRKAEQYMYRAFLMTEKACVLVRSEEAASMYRKLGYEHMPIIDRRPDGQVLVYDDSKGAELIRANDPDASAALCWIARKFIYLGCPLPHHLRKHTEAALWQYAQNLRANEGGDRYRNFSRNRNIKSAYEILRNRGMSKTRARKTIARGLERNRIRVSPDAVRRVLERLLS